MAAFEKAEPMKNKNTKVSTKANTRVIIWAVAAVAILGVGFMMFSPSDSGAQVENVSADRMSELAQTGTVIIDVRTLGEYEAGHIPGAVNMPVDQLSSAASSLDPAVPVAVYCATGSRSVAAVEYFEGAGFEKVYHFNQGMVAWAGDVERGAVAAAAPSADETPLDSPVLYEFYTDW